MIRFNTVKWFYVFISNTKNSIFYKSFVCTELNGFNYCYERLIMLYNINHLLPLSQVVTTLLFNTNSSTLIIC